MDTLILDFTGRKNLIVTKLVNQFLSGMKGAGVAPKVIDIDKLNILNCKGCTEDINFVSNGDCICEDDFRSLYPELHRSENLIFIFDLSNKSFWQKLFYSMNRMEPLYDFSSNRGENVANKNIFAIIFSAGDKDSTLDVLIKEIDSFALLIGGKFSGYAYRPDYETLNIFDEKFIEHSRFSKGFFEAGVSIAHNKSLDSVLIRKIGDRIFDKNSLLDKIYQDLHKRTLPE